MTTWTAIAFAALVLVDAILHKLHWDRAAALADKAKDALGAK